MALVLLLALLTVACRPQLVVLLSTTVYRDGSLSRSVEVRGRTPEGEQPTDPDWLAESVGIELARPAAWSRVERFAGGLRAEGFFADATDLPGLLAFRIDDAAKSGNIDTRLTVEERSIARRWLFVERHGDPYGPAESAQALDALTELAVRAVREELRRQFGDDLETAAAEQVLRDEGRRLAAALIGAGRAAPGWERSQARVERWREILIRAGLPAADRPADEFWDAQTPVILDWLRGRVAAALSTPERPLTPDALTFWPRGEDYLEQVGEITDRVWGGEEQLAEEVLPYLGVLGGYYGSDASPRVRFEARLRLPGVLLRTNGTPAGDSVVWLFREQGLNGGEAQLEAESIELQTEPLTALGARRELEPAALLRLADLLWRQDPQGGLEAVLAEALRRGSLAPLRDEELEPPELQPLAQELADLLDPEVPLPLAP